MKKLIIGLLLSFLSFSLNATQGEVLINDPVLGTERVIYDEMQGSAVMEGDILIGTLNDVQSKAIIVRRLFGGRWAKRTVPYEITLLPPSQISQIRAAIAHIQSKTHVKFVEITESNKSKYADFVVFVSGNTCASYVGRQGGKQEIILDFPGCRTGAIIHELAHALGLFHEQSRADRDRFVKIQWKNIEKEEQHNFEIHNIMGYDFKKYDYDSIMHYGAYAFSKNGKPTIVPLVEGVSIGNTYGLSDGDIAAINYIYPK